MGGGIKSKFKFPIPGRSSKKQEVPTVSVSGPLSKAQRVLGADGINIGPSRLAVDHGRTWETGSTGGISISVSESSASQATHEPRFDREDGRRTRWDEESAIIPRQIRSAHGSDQRGLATKRSIFTVGNESRDNVTNVSTRGRRLSSSTIDTHYDSAKMPLAISQQTSNSAMAKGLPTKANELLDMDGTLAGTQTAKKKPARLDLSRLRPKGFKDRNRNAPAIHPILGNGYVMRSPSFMSQVLESPMPPFVTEGPPRTPPKITNQSPATRQSPRSRGITDAAGLHQLYHHYEQMSFQHEETSEEEANREHLPPHSERHLGKPRPASTFTHSLIAPLPLALPPGQETSWGHSRSNSHDSRITNSIADSSRGLQVHSLPRKDYAGSVSSRHTRTSKASPSSKSIVESDRLQSSVLSLSDSSDDEAAEPAPPAPLPRRESVMHYPISENSNTSRSQQSPNSLHGTTSPRRFMPSLNQVDEHLAVKPASRTQNSRSPSNNTLSSSHSSMSTLTPAHLSPSSPGSTETVDTLGSLHQPGFGAQHARAVSFMPLASTVEAASKAPVSDSHHLEKVLLRQNSSATSHFSRSSEQPTPPLSPNSVEFYVKSRESLQRDAMTGDSIEAHNARLMAVTRQEEMLLAALRQKRAKMRETVISEVEEDGKGRTSRASRSSTGSTNKSNTTGGKGVPMRPAMLKPHPADSVPAAWSTRLASRLGGSRENLREADRQNGLRRGLRGADVPSTASRSDVTERTSTSATESTTSTTFDSRNDQILLFFDQPANSITTADSSVDFSDDYMEDSDGEDLIVNERRTSRRQSQRDSASSSARGQRTSSAGSQRESSGYNGQYRKDSIIPSPLHVPARGYRLQDVPEDEDQSECNDVDADELDNDDLDVFPQPPMPPPSWPLPPRPERPPTKPTNHSPASTNFLHPSTATHQGQRPEHQPRHIKNKRSMVRLSAVGRSHAAMPYWGDED
ncbi:hypothetical protein GGS24DRAFT_499462 [Hypoxylon argillaceum]|nr:hypothetical protein GGS24DRAFT_499462 [Hypoxylon argillaceum]